MIPNEDMVSLDTVELNSAQKQRGKKPGQGKNTIPFYLTRTQCVSKVVEVFNITGKITPITTAMTFGMRTLVPKGLS